MPMPDQTVLSLLSLHCLMALRGHSLAGQNWQQRKPALKVQWGPAGPSGTGGYNFAPPPSYNLPPQSNWGQAGGGYNFAPPPSYGATPSTAGCTRPLPAAVTISACRNAQQIWFWQLECAFPCRLVLTAPDIAEAQQYALLCDDLPLHICPTQQGINCMLYGTLPPSCLSSCCL